MIRKYFLKIIPLFFLLFILVPVKIEADYWKNSKYADLIIELKKAGFSSNEIDSIFSDPRVEFYPSIAEKLKRAKVPKLTDPNSKLLSENSVADGKKFIREKKAILERIEEDYWIKKDAIASIVRIESNFGRNKGSDQVFGVFNSMILHYSSGSKRAKWAKEQMLAFLTICRREGFNPFEIKGSCAGAFGIPQFLPTSYLKFAVDGNKDGKIDLFDWEDALPSIANYLIKNALHSYNPSWNYVAGIEAYARKLKE